MKQLEDLNVDWGECCLARLHPDLGSNVRMPSDQASFPPIGALPGWRDCVPFCNFILNSWFILYHIYSWVIWVLIWQLESLPQLPQVYFSVHMGEFSRFDPQRISIYSCMASIWKSPQQHAPRNFDLRLVYDLVALSCHVHRSIRPSKALSILLSCLSIRFQGRFDLGFLFFQ